MPKKIALSELGIFLINYEFEAYQQTVDIVDSHVQKIHNDRKQAICQQAEGIYSESDLEDFYEYHADDLEEINYSNEILMHSLFVGAWALFEFQLLRLCERAKRRIKNPNAKISHHNFSMTNAKKYLEDLGVDVPFDSRAWADAKRYEKIRNLIVHEGGQIKYTNGQDLSDYAKYRGIINVADVCGTTRGQLYTLRLNSSFCKEVLNTLKQLLLNLQQRCDNAPTGRQ